MTHILGLRSLQFGLGVEHDDFFVTKGLCDGYGYDDSLFDVYAKTAD